MRHLPLIFFKEAVIPKDYCASKKYYTNLWWKILFHFSIRKIYYLCKITRCIAYILKKYAQNEKKIVYPLNYVESFLLDYIFSCIHIILWKEKHSYYKDVEKV